MRKGRFAAKVKKVLLKVAETKHYRFAGENQQLYHNTGVSGYSFSGPIVFNPWNSITKGTEAFNRVGDTIIPRGMSLRLWLANKYDRPNLMYRVTVCILPRTVKNAVVGPGTIDLGVLS